MEAGTLQPFRFLDLPRELRDKIYKICLCSFYKCPGKQVLKASLWPERSNLKCAIAISLLCTNKQIYHEGFEVMVKTNRFVLIEFEDVIPLQPILTNLYTPIVTVDSKAIDRVKGVVLVVHISGDTQAQSRDDSTAPTRILILARDLEIFCSDLADFGLHCEDLVRWDLSLILGSSMRPSSGPDPLTNFYTSKVQRELLEPFLTFVRGFKNVHIHGNVDQELRTSVCYQLRRNPDWNAEEVSRDLEAANEKGYRLLHDGEYKDAFETGWRGALRIEGLQTRRDGTWNMLIHHGRRSFLDRIAHAYFLTRLNIADAGLSLLRIETDSSLSLAVEYDLHLATVSLQAGHWSQGYQWLPLDKELAMLHHRQALFLRLGSNPDNVNAALQAIIAALYKEPDNPTMMRDRDDIIAWKLSIDPRE
ncbi:hypothetical protein K491DRAFT_668576 [Lophiostoma macrostomum CBS 122681]|uniref:Uncharacterized protein n=1 Tax=Lophiostoma macrostomum CBS 122681 TaxID=1314788 RepID=A0A6A6SRN7_9PLEO|nr:hypothetical protein K491DRAFT_668576 [Lophiostoma macrostomum CBS 122681]